MANFVFFVLGNFTLTFLVIGLIFSLAAIARAPRPLPLPVVVEKLFSWFIFFSIGMSYIYNGLFHTIGHEMAARLIGWADSPFQIELGFASLGLGWVGLIAPWKSIEMRFAVIVPIVCFLWGAAGVHVNSMITDVRDTSGDLRRCRWAGDGSGLSLPGQGLLPSIFFL
jgi:Family of unknown function (DUF6790)